MLDRILAFTRALRRAGIPVAISESLDVARALAFVPSEDRETLRAALATTLIKAPGHRRAFDTLFDLYFGSAYAGTALVPGDAEASPAAEPAAGAEAPGERTGHGAGDDPAAFIETLAAALLGAGGAGIGALAQHAVARFGRAEGPLGTSPYFRYRVERALDLDAVLERLLARVDTEAEGLDARVLRGEIEERLRAFRAEVDAEVLRLLAAHRGPDAAARHAVRPLPEDLDILLATRAEVAELRRAVRPLAWRLAARLALKRRHGRRGRLDVRRTVRASLGTGGVPFDPRFRRPAPHRPELFLLCDVSGSVASFARFTLMLVHALQSEFNRVRSFAFVDTLDEVTALFEQEREDVGAAAERVLREARVVGLDGHSDYGSALTRFWERHGRDVGPRASVLVLGDARNNYREPAPWILAALRRNARRVYWLNPESAASWDTGDSVVAAYRPHLDAMVEVRTLRQLERFITRIA